MNLRRLPLIVFCIALACGLTHHCSGADWKQSLPGWSYEFPRDHWTHPEFKTEWWYFTGRVSTADGRVFGYQVTFFRQGVRPAEAEPKATSRFVVHSFAFGHAALTDLGSKRFRFAQKLSRGVFDEAGFGQFAPDGGRVAWLEDWQLTIDAAGNYAIVADVEGARLELKFTGTKPWTIHGLEGLSQKAEGVGRASHYYSGTRLKTEGAISIDGRELTVTGESWFDHEWASNQLTPEQIGWNWFSLQFDDGAELMLYQMRLKDGGLDPYSSGTFVDSAGRSTHLTRDDYTAVPIGYWKSPDTQASYPIEWKVTVPKLGIEVSVTTPLKKQELHLDPVAYWEGLIDLSGTRAGAPIRGHGYLELTGYAGALVGLTSSDPAGAK